MRKFKIYVWYRYVIAGEQEKDYMDHEIEASNVREAMIKAKDLYKSFSKIPFSIECGILKVKPNML